MEDRWKKQEKRKGQGERERYEKRSREQSSGASSSTTIGRERGLPLSPPPLSAGGGPGAPPGMVPRMPGLPPPGLGLLGQLGGMLSGHHGSPLELMAAHHAVLPPRSYNSPPPISTSDPTANECKLVDYRGQKVAAFIIAGDTMLCLPQAFELFLKHLVGGLHTVYTKLKRLDIVPLVCNVEQVRILRGLGAIQPGVNRCKLLSCKDFDILYRDCTTASSRPGRPPKRASVGLSLAASHLAAAAGHHPQHSLKKHRLDNGDYYENGHLDSTLGTTSMAARLPACLPACLTRKHVEVSLTDSDGLWIRCRAENIITEEVFQVSVGNPNFLSFPNFPFWYQENMITEEVFQVLAGNPNFLSFPNFPFWYQENMITEEVFQVLAGNPNFLSFPNFPFWYQENMITEEVFQVLAGNPNFLSFPNFPFWYQENMITEEVFQVLAGNPNFLSFPNFPFWYQENMITEEVFQVLAGNPNFLSFPNFPFWYQENMITEEYQENMITEEVFQVLREI
ncbi:Dachshund-like protein 1 [Harpegnathos saltator]|uniref:Dachshund-like protein 1 n=1 Tax=Harpegnathos saltator TaxID=610380 RepID=E2BMN2_HARSA|nr:Dachshund-like protein 1 [Harpegnathos saltator]